MKNKKESWWTKFLKWIEKASKKQPPSCGGGCCKK
jgi:poly(3-hydroxyalkanoate) synthetase